MKKIRVLYSFPHKIGADRICYSAWQQVNGISKAGAEVTLFSGATCRPLPPQVRVHTTLSWHKLRIPYKLIGTTRACFIHDWLVSRFLAKFAHEFDFVHTWPLGALRTLRVANTLGIASGLERPNAHTRYAYRVVEEECRRLGVPLPKDHEHAFNNRTLGIEELEYAAAFRLLCPSDFVVRTFVEEGFPAEKLVRNMRGFDVAKFYPGNEERASSEGLQVLFVGVCAVRKGLHYALEAWLKSTASKRGRFRIAGEFLPAYKEKLSPLLSHHSIEVLGHRNDVPELMRNSDVLVLPSLEEGSAKATSEARASGCVLVVSDASGANCTHMENSLVHRAGDAGAILEHLNLLDSDRQLLQCLRRNSLSTLTDLTWEAGGRKLVEAYREIVAKKHEHCRVCN